MNVSVSAYLDRTKIPVSIDIGFNGLIYPERTEMDFPITLEDNGVPHIYAYSLYSSVAEKFEAIVSPGYPHSNPNNPGIETEPIFDEVNNWMPEGLNKDLQRNGEQYEKSIMYPAYRFFSNDAFPLRLC